MFHTGTTCMYLRLPWHVPCRHNTTFKTCSILIRHTCTLDYLDLFHADTTHLLRHVSYIYHIPIQLHRHVSCRHNTMFKTCVMQTQHNLLDMFYADTIYLLWNVQWSYDIHVTTCFFTLTCSMQIRHIFIPTLTCSIL